MRDVILALCVAGMGTSLLATQLGISAKDAWRSAYILYLFQLFAGISILATLFLKLWSALAHTIDRAILH